MQLRAAPHGALGGRIRVPGDKSISHRSLMLAGLAVGESRVSGLLEGEDVIATARAMRALGCAVERDGDGEWTVHGRGTAGMAEPADVLDMGNAGTGARLLMGILAGHAFTTTITGDASLRSRPMGRIREPLERMGAMFMARRGDRLPLALRGSDTLLPIDYESPVASAQVKSAVMLAGLHAAGRTTVTEPLPSRDHTERMLTAMGASIESEKLADGRLRVSVTGQQELRPQRFVVPGDPSSAAFPLAAAALRAKTPVTIEGISVNPLRIGLVTTLREMGASITFANERTVAGEPVADLVVEAAELRGIEVPAARVPSMVDEYPVLSVVAAFAGGETVMRGLAELRVKETDRLAVMADGLASCGVDVRIEGDDLIVRGGATTRRATIDAKLDHRIAMSFLVLGGLGREPVTVSGAEAIDTSFPGFGTLMNGLGADITKATSS
ncbi:MAG: 3-phosphoshikimate 1-carboxyvinyltransferase [Geminicoccaceae bacterium]